MGSGSQPEDNDPRIGIAEAGYRFSPILAVAIGTALLASNLLAIRDQSRATGAGNDLGVEFVQPVARPISPHHSHFTMMAGGATRKVRLANRSVRPTPAPWVRSTLELLVRTLVFIECVVRV